MESDKTEEFFIPYKFHDNIDELETTVFCRGTESGKNKNFTLRQKSWMVIDPFRYPDESEEDAIESLQRTFKTSHVYYDNNDRFLIRDYTLEDFNEYDYKYVSFLPDTYTTKIIMNKKRFFNLFSDKGEWLDTRGVGYPDIKKRHLLVYHDKSKDVLMYKVVIDESFQVLGESDWDLLRDEVDIIFSTVKQTVFEDKVSFKVPDRVDFAWISPEWRSDHLDVWYSQMIPSLYELSFISSRNMSDILSIDSRKGWEYLTDDIILSVNLSLYESTKINRFPKNFCSPGKYSKLYCYNIGDILLRLLESSHCRETINIWKRFRSLNIWSPIITNIYNYERLNPSSFVIPDSCVYMDNKYLITTHPLENDFVPVKTVGYMIVISEGSYLTFDVESKVSIFKGKHPLCQPLFPAVKRSIENYMLCSARNFDVNIEAICDLTDKTKDSLRVITKVTKANCHTYKDILDEKSLEKLELNKVKEVEIPTWLRENNMLSTKFDPKESLSASNTYIQNVLHSLDKIE